MRHELIPLEEPERWRQALSGIDHAFGHTWENCHAMSLTTGYPTFLYQFETKDARIVCPIAEREFEGEVDIVTPLGFSGFAGVGSCASFPAEWKRFALERGWVCGYLVVNPLLCQQDQWRDEDWHRRHLLYVLDLALGETQLLDQLSRSRKRQIRAWADGGGGFVSDREAIAKFLIEHSTEFFLSRNASETYALSPETWHTLLDSSNVLPVGATKGNQIVGVTVFGFSPSIGDALFDVSLPAGRGTAPALIWEGALRLLTSGVSLLNIGGGVRQGDSVEQSKKQYGARALPFHCLKQVYDADRFASLCHRAGADPDDRSGYFPPYRKPGAA